MRHVVVIGAGIGGLSAAVLLAARGVRVTVLERAPTPGGKMRRVQAGGAAIDAGPTVFTMRWVFDALFADADARLDDHLTLTPAEILARHAWDARAHLDLFADIGRSADAIGALAGPDEARGFLAFCARARRIYQTLEAPFIRAALPTTLSLVRSAGLADLWHIAPFATLWQALGEHFKDPRLRQLFGRYATYSGSSPFLAPATLMLIAHVEQQGVWLIEGGMHRLAGALADLAIARGCTLRYSADVAEIGVVAGRASWVCLDNGERIEADAVVVNADTAALGEGCFGAAAKRAVPPTPRAARSLSAVTWAIQASTAGFPLSRHNVFFSDDYDSEFTDLIAHRRLPAQPTVYVCAQDRRDDHAAPSGPERLLCLVNAPANGDAVHLTEMEIAECTRRMMARLNRCGLQVVPHATVTTTPMDFERLFPATGGALYGPAVHGAMATFRRPGSRSKLPGLYLAGGSTHPGAGVPMAALSGRLAAEAVLADWASTGRSRMMAMRGGTSMRSAMTGSTPSR